MAARADAAGALVTVALEDTDPYRDCYHRPASARLTAAEHGRWQRQQAAWQLIQRDYPRVCPAIAASLTVIMPLRQPGGPRRQRRRAERVRRHRRGPAGRPRDPGPADDA